MNELISSMIEVSRQIDRRTRNVSDPGTDPVIEYLHIRFNLLYDLALEELKRLADRGTLTTDQMVLIRDMMTAVMRARA